MTGSSGLENDVIVAVRRITRAIDLHSRSMLKEHGLTFPQVTTIQALAHLQPVTVGSLARQIHLGPATVTGILDRLERRGLVRRARADRDRRSVLVQLTTTGEDLIRTAPSLLHRRFHDELSRLQPWEQMMILATLQRIATMMDTPGIPAAAAGSQSAGGA